MKIWKKWSYTVLMLAAGLFYLKHVDEWQVYAEPMEQVKGIYREILNRQEKESIPVVSESENNMTQVSSKESQEADVQSEEAVQTEEAVTEPEQSWEDVQQPWEEVVEEIPLIPTYTKVEDDYFSDAVFIGDSRTDAMFLYGDLEEIATFYASTGLTIHTLFESDIVEVPGQKKKVTIEEALQQNSFGKIYLMVGINEMGRGTVESFIEKYEEVVTRLRELQPDAIIYIQGIMKVTAKRSGQGDYIHNEGIELRNTELEKLADNRQVFYLDVNPLICDENGGMIEEYTFDGVHLKARYIQIWKDYLKEHAIQ